MQILKTKNAKRKITMQLFVNNNSRFYYQTKEKPETLLEECKTEQKKKIKIENLIDDDLKKVNSMSRIMKVTITKQNQTIPVMNSMNILLKANEFF